MFEKHVTEIAVRLLREKAKYQKAEEFITRLGLEQVVALADHVVLYQSVSYGEKIPGIWNTWATTPRDSIDVSLFFPVELKPNVRAMLFETDYPKMIKRYYVNHYYPAGQLFVEEWYCKDGEDKLSLKFYQKAREGLEADGCAVKLVVEPEHVAAESSYLAVVCEKEYNE